MASEEERQGAWSYPEISLTAFPPMDCLRQFTPVRQGWIAIATFFPTAALLILGSTIMNPWLLVIIETIFVVFLYRSWKVSTNSQIVLLTNVIGVAFSIGTILWLNVESFYFFGLYVMVLSAFHFSEYVATSVCNPRTLSNDSFLLNHSSEYSIAAVASWLEYGIEVYFFPATKSFHWISWTGILLCVSGEILRKGAMLTAMANFTHMVRYYKVSDHHLVTTGIYSWFRHPSYVGWFYWSIGTQLILANPVCLAAYTLVAWRFFSERILVEEELLVGFFGSQYRDYQKKVGTGLPFIKGYQCPENTVNMYK